MLLFVAWARHEGTTAKGTLDDAGASSESSEAAASS